MIVAGDFNQNIDSTEMKQLHSKIGVEDLYHRHYNILLNEIDKTHISRLTPIDSIAASEGAMEFVEGLKLINDNNIAFSEHCAYVVYFNIEEYFNAQLSYHDEINHIIINLSKRSYREKFCKALEDHLNRWQIEGLTFDNLRLSCQQIEHLDAMITTVLNNTQKSVEGPKQNVLYSKKKEKCREALIY